MSKHGMILLFCLMNIWAAAQASKPIAEIFLPGIVSGDSIDFNACFSRDGYSFYFSRSVNKKTGIYEIHVVNGVWTKPALLPFCSDGFSYADPAFSPSGELYFISNRPASKSDTLKDYDILKTSFMNGHWTEPVNVSALNSAGNEYYISFTANGDAYFSSSRPGGYGEEDIYMSKFVNGDFEEPENVGAAVNSIHSEYDPFISDDGSILIFASSGRADSFGKADLYWTEKHQQWGPAHHFDKSINTPTRDYCPYVSTRGDFFFSSEGQVKTMPLRLILNR